LSKGGQGESRGRLIDGGVENAGLKDFCHDTNDIYLELSIGISAYTWYGALLGTKRVSEYQHFTST
jgi:hypothetical protein